MRIQKEGLNQSQQPFNEGLVFAVALHSSSDEADKQGHEPSHFWVGFEVMK